MMADYDEEDIEYYATLWDVEPEQVEALLDVLDPNDLTRAFEEGPELHDEIWDDFPLDEHGRPDPDYMFELAELFDVDVSDLYDLYYGCGTASI